MLPVVLGLLAALLYAVSAWMQHDQAQKVQRGGGFAPGVASLLRTLWKRLSRQPLWWTGWAINVGGFFVQATALFFGSVALVQPLLASQLLFTLPLATWQCRRWPTLLEWASGSSITAGVVVFVASYRGGALTGTENRHRILLAAIVAAGAVAVLIRASARRAPTAQATLVAVASGLCLAVSAAMMKLTSGDLFHRGIGATAADWPGYALAVSAVSAVVLGHWAYATGSLPAAVATVTITNPVTSYLIGILAFSAQGPTSFLRLVGVLLAGLFISAGVLGLSRSSIVTVS